MSVAIDFTASNGEPTNKDSLHYNESGKHNQYETAMREVGKILESYAYKKKFIGYGFGGIPES